MRPFLFAAGVAVGLTLSAIVAAAWTGPTQAPPGDNVTAPVNVGATGQIKQGPLGVTGYLNFGSTLGDSGYGIWDNAGTLEFKNEGGSWASLQSVIQSTVSSLVGSITSGQWQTGANGAIYYNGGDVGINTASPSRILDIDNGLSAAGNGSVRVLGYQAAFEVFNRAGTANWYFGNNDGDSNSLYIGRGYGPNQGIAPVITITQAQNVGIGTTNPSYTLQVNGNEYVSGNIYSGSRGMWMSEAARDDGGQFVYDWAKTCPSGSVVVGLFGSMDQNTEQNFLCQWIN